MTRGESPAGVRALGILGIVGGLVILLAFVVEIPSAWNTVRLVLFGTGAIGVAVAALGPHAHVSRALALTATIPVIVANACFIGWVVLAVGRDSPFAGDFGLVGFWAGLSVWLADAWFGLVALRLAVLRRWAVVALVVGSLLALTGIDRLGLTSQANPTIFSPLSLTGIGLNAIAWVALGLDVVALGIRRPRTRDVTASHA